jgi:predicted RNA methylase
LTKKHEDHRLTLQAALDAKKTQAERNAMGQFATPTALAREIVEYAAGLLPTSQRIRFIDPAIGTGSFYSALRHVVPTKRVKRAVGFEIDAHYGRPAQDLWAGTSLAIRHEDFTAADTPTKDAERFNLVVCNPPYVRHHHIQNGKTRLQEASEKACGVRIGGLSGLYCYFLALSHPWMSADGIGAWLIPSEFMDVNYGRFVKKYLLSTSLLRIHRFDPNHVQFGDALVSSAVVFFRNRPPPAAHEVEFSFGGSISRPTRTRMVAAKVLCDEPKWTRFPIAEPRAKHTGVTLNDLFRIKRGLATGDNSFFIMSREQIEERDLPQQFFKPILPSPRYLDEDRIKADEDGNPDIGRQLFILDCRLHEHEVREQYPSLWSYLETGMGVAERYLCRHRKPWYSQEDRPPAPFVCTYLGRSDKKNGKPFRFILNESQATAANVYLLLYPKPALARQLEREPRLAKRIWEFLNSITPDSLLGEGRVYGGGLHKLEPRELGNVAADDIAELARIPRGTIASQADLFGDRALS